MTSVKDLFERNRAWAASMRAADPEFFSSLAHQQTPEFLWIGCSDSRVPANQITGLAPGVAWLWDKQPMLESKNVNGVVNVANASWDLTFTSLK